MSKIIVLISCLSLIALYGCPSRPLDCKQFYELPRESRPKLFKEYPLEKQLDLYLCGMKGEPPDLSLAYAIADRGEVSIPVSLQKLKTLKNENDQENIIYLFEVMADRGLLRDRKDVVADISHVVEGMKFSLVKQSSEERLARIRQTSGIKPFTYSPDR